MQISHDATRRGTAGVVVRLANAADAAPAELCRRELPEFGLPETIDVDEAVGNRALAVPDDVLEALGAALPAPDSSTLNAVWLEFPSPRGYLHLLSWEAALGALGRPVFRRRPHPLRPANPGATLSVAVCASAAALTKPALWLLPLAYALASNRPVTFHVFTDDYSRDKAVWRRLFHWPVVVHGPATVDDGISPPRSPNVDPCLRWMRRVAERAPFDWVHFHSAGFLSGEHGAIALPAPRPAGAERAWSPLIGAAEIGDFLSQVGAWGYTLSSPDVSASPAALRELADSLAAVHPAVGVVHTIGDDRGSADLRAALAVILGTPAAAVSALRARQRRSLPAVSCWLPTQFVEPDGPKPDNAARLGLDEDGSSAFLGPAVRARLASPGAPTWVAAATRALEVQQLAWLPDSPAATLDPAARGALGDVGALLDGQARRLPGAPLGERAAEKAGGGEPPTATRGGER